MIQRQCLLPVSLRRCMSMYMDVQRLPAKRTDDRPFARSVQHRRVDQEGGLSLPLLALVSQARSRSVTARVKVYRCMDSNLVSWLQPNCMKSTSGTRACCGALQYAISSIPGRTWDADGYSHRPLPRPQANSCEFDAPMWAVLVTSHQDTVVQYTTRGYAGA